MLITIPNYVKSKGGWIEYHIYVDSEFQGTGFSKSSGESEWVTHYWYSPRQTFL